MNDTSICVQLHRCCKFHRYLIVEGNCSLNAKEIKSIELANTDIIHSNTIWTADPNKSESKFEIHALRSSDKALNKDACIAFEINGKTPEKISIKKLLEKIHNSAESEQLRQQFKSLLKERKINNVLDIGGRNRSNINRSKEYPDQDITVLDIHQGDNVDIIGDAHELDKIFPAKSFEAVFSIAVFEHLAMPWKVSLGINHCLQDNGIAYIATHQSIGMHDMPWDFWRYSDRSWHSLFNQRTGFRVIKTALSEPVHITPFHYLDAMSDSEHAAGFLISAVLVEKTHSVQNLAWPIKISDFVDSQYPTS